MKWFKRVGYFILTNILVVLTISLIVGVITHFLGINLNDQGYAGLFALCLLWGFVGAFFSLLISRWSAKMFHGVKVIDPNTTVPAERKFLDTVYGIARRAGLEKMPEVGYYESAEVNAFATGPTKNRSLVAVSSGLLNTMSDAEVEGVLAHEIAHIVNGDMVTLTLVQGVVNSFAMFIAQIVTMAVMNALRRDDDRRGMGDFFLRQMIYTTVSVVTTLLGSIVVAYFSRAREFRADAGGARFSTTEKMTAALQRLQRLHDIPQQQTPADKNEASIAAFKISGRTSGIARLFMTHPPLEERIEALRNKTYASSI